MARRGVAFIPKLVAGSALALITAIVVFAAHRVLLKDVPESERVGRRAVPAAPGFEQDEREGRTSAGSAVAAPDSADPREPGHASAFDSADVPVAALSPDAPESFRNTSILIAIRETGFVCQDIIAAHAVAADPRENVDAGTIGDEAADAGPDEGVETGTAMAVWRVVCDDAVVFLVGTDDNGNLAVDPVPYGHRSFDFDSPQMRLDQPGQPPRGTEQPLPR